MQNTARRPKIMVSDDGSGVVSQAGALLLTETARITGLGAGLSAFVLLGVVDGDSDVAYGVHGHRADRPVGRN